MAVRLTWTAQPADLSTQRAESGWQGSPGLAAELATALRQWPMIRFEVTEDSSLGLDGERIAYVPGRGIFRTAVSASGDIVVGEDRLRALLASSPAPDALAHGLDRLLGSDWDADLEPYRHAGEGAPVTWLYAV